MQIRRHRREGFTLVELMLVVVIIGILAGVVIPNVTGMRRKAAIRATKGQIQALETTINMFQMDTDQFPPDLSALSRDPGGVSGWDGPYTDKGKTPKDAWKREFFYGYPGQHNEGSYDLWSAGPDGVDDQGENDDVVNWETDEED